MQILNYYNYILFNAYRDITLIDINVIVSVFNNFILRCKLVHSI